MSSLQLRLVASFLGATKINSVSVQVCRNRKLEVGLVVPGLNRASRENLNSTFTASHIQMAINFDVLDRFQENKALQTAQIINNILRSSKKW